MGNRRAGNLVSVKDDVTLTTNHTADLSTRYPPAMPPPPPDPADEVAGADVCTSAAAP